MQPILRCRAGFIKPKNNFFSSVPFFFVALDKPISKSLKEKLFVAFHRVPTFFLSPSLNMSREFLIVLWQFFKVSLDLVASLSASIWPQKNYEFTRRTADF